MIPHKEMRPKEVLKPKFFYTRLNKGGHCLTMNFMTMEANEPPATRLFYLQKPGNRKQSLSIRQMITEPRSLGILIFLLPSPPPISGTFQVYDY